MLFRKKNPRFCNYRGNIWKRCHAAYSQSNKENESWCFLSTTIMLLLALPMIIEGLDSPVSCVIFKLLCFVVLFFLWIDGFDFFCWFYHCPAGRMWGRARSSAPSLEWSWPLPPGRVLVWSHSAEMQAAVQFLGCNYRTSPRLTGASRKKQSFHVKSWVCFPLLFDLGDTIKSNTVVRYF